MTKTAKAQRDFEAFWARHPEFKTYEAAFEAWEILNSL